MFVYIPSPSWPAIFTISDTAYLHQHSLKLFTHAMTPSISLDPHRQEIVDLIHHGSTANDISRLLLEKYDINVTKSTLNRYIASKRLRSENPQVQLEDLDTLLRDLSRHLGPKEVLKVLRKKGFRMTGQALYSHRSRLGNQFRTTNPEAERERWRFKLDAIVSIELKDGAIDYFGEHSLYAHFRDQGYDYTREEIDSALCRIDPEGVERRRRAEMISSAKDEENHDRAEKAWHSTKGGRRSSI